MWWLVVLQTGFPHCTPISFPSASQDPVSISCGLVPAALWLAFCLFGIRIRIPRLGAAPPVDSKPTTCSKVPTLFRWYTLQQGDQSSPKGNQPWTCTGRTEAEAPIFWLPDMKNQLIWKDSRWERLRAREGNDRGRDGLSASPTQCTWVWANSRRWWRAGKPGVLQSRGSQRVRCNLVTEQLPQQASKKSLWKCAEIALKLLFNLERTGNLKQSVSTVLLPNQTCLSDTQPARRWGVQWRGLFIHEEPGEQFKSASPRPEAWDTYWIKLRHGERGRADREGNGKVTWFSAGTKLQASPSDFPQKTSVCMLWRQGFQLSSSWRVLRVPASPNQLGLELNTADATFLKAQCWGLEDRQGFVKK